MKANLGIILKRDEQSLAERESDIRPSMGLDREERGGTARQGSRRPRRGKTKPAGVSVFLRAVCADQCCFSVRLALPPKACRLAYCSKALVNCSL